MPIHLRLTHFRDVELVVAALAEQLHEHQMLFMGGYLEYAGTNQEQYSSEICLETSPLGSGRFPEHVQALLDKQPRNGAHQTRAGDSVPERLI